MATVGANEELCRISEGLYTIVNWEIGQESVIKSKRQTFDSCSQSKNRNLLISGSKAEGFSFNSSDIDVMAINKNMLVIDNELQNVLNTNFFPVVILMETDNAPPGFTLLKCIKNNYTCSRADIHDLDKILVRRGDGDYMSSERAQQVTIWRGKTTVHGPCRSGTMYGIEYDCAYALKCLYWPQRAHSFIRRSNRYGWPSTEDLIDICKEGCLLVPISSKQFSFSDRELEWRISFSVAEKKLVYSMNHCQFLCYGLMKIFLNEVLKEVPVTKTENGNVLCSYFMKTAVFWEMSESGNDWSIRNFLDKFLNVFRRVIRWVEEGYCPNFFIPEHNMFCGKIYGRRRGELMLRLRSLYGEGIMCLTRCTSLSGMLCIMLNDRIQFNEVQMRRVYSDAYSREKEVIRMIGANAKILVHDIGALTKELCYTASLVPDSAEVLSAIKFQINFTLQIMAILLAKRGFHHLSSNKSQYLFTKRARSILRKTKTAYCMETIHQAVISYMNGEYYKTIQICDYIQQRLQSQPYTYGWVLDRSIVMGCRQQGMSYEKIEKTFIVEIYEYNTEISIPELALEIIAQNQNNPVSILFILPLVFLNYLIILCYTRLNRPAERKAVLDVLQSMFYQNNNQPIDFRFRAISWEILGICQQICGDNVSAYKSYLNALNDKENEFKEATIIRILILLFDLHNHS